MCKVIMYKLFLFVSLLERCYRVSVIGSVNNCDALDFMFKGLDYLHWNHVFLYENMQELLLVLNDYGVHIFAQRAFI